MKRAISVSALIAGISFFLLSNRLNSQSDLMHLSGQPGPVPASYFGMHIHEAATTTPWPSVPFASWRLWDAHVAWPYLEPKPGKWNFTLLDKYLQLAQDHHVQIVLPLALSPQWASARPTEHSTYQPGFAAEPKQLGDWYQYVTAVVQHCKGKVQAYEIWNEPNYKIFWSGRTDQLLDLTKAAHDIIKSVDPNAILVSPSATNGLEGATWLDQFLEQGGGKYVDAIGFHFYSKTPEAMVPVILKVRQTMAKHNLASLPLWNTETGFAKPKPFPSPELAAGYLVRTYLLNWAAGVQRVYWYAWDNHKFVSIETTQADNRTLTPAGEAYRTLTSWLTGAQLQSCDMTADHTWTCTLHRSNGDQRVVWNEDHETDITPPPSWHATSATPLIASASNKLNQSTLRITQIPQLIGEANPTTF